ncbi:hypothetical protein AC482_01860, partial [miscellaneous Crenarchaeota group-15 archaeon DG-45]
MDRLEILGRVASKVAPGRSLAYSEAHVLKALQLIGSGESIGRQRLSNELGVGEGTMRTLIRRLKDEGLARSSRRGLSLTGPGLEVLSHLSGLLAETALDGTSITVGSRDYAVLVRGASAFIRRGVEQRDAALLSGAEGATTLLFDGERVGMPGTELRLEESTAQ